jgi:hypothetical protein
METGEHDALLPVISTVLQFTPEEIERINQGRKAHSFWGSVPSPVPFLLPTTSATHSRLAQVWGK